MIVKCQECDGKMQISSVRMNVDYADPDSVVRRCSYKSERKDPSDYLSCATLRECIKAQAGMLIQD